MLSEISARKKVLEIEFKKGKPGLINKIGELKKNMETLNILENQFGVGKAELSTGIVLKNDKSYFLGDVEVDGLFEVFETYQSAKEFAINEVLSNPKIECWIINSKNEMVFCYDQNGERKV